MLPRRWPLRALVPLLALLVACGGTLRHGRRLAEDGAFEAAARYYMAAIDEDLDDPTPRKGLDEVAADAVALHLDVARGHEAEQRYDEALASFDAAVALAGELSEYGVATGLDVAAVEVEREEVVQTYAAYRYDQGVAAFERHEWDEAVRWWALATELTGGYRDVIARSAEARRRQGLDLVATGDYAGAITAFEYAFGVNRDPISAAWLEATSLALGRHWLADGSCRAALEVFERVAKTSVDPSLPEEIERARDCARVELVVLPFEASVPAPVPGADLAGLVTVALEEQLSATASRHVRLLDPTRAADVERLSGRRWEVKGRVTQASFERGAAATTTETVAATTQVECPIPEGYSTPSERLCDAPAVLSADVTRSSVAFALAGSVRASDPVSAEQVLARSVDARAHHARAVRTTLRRPDGAAATVGEAPGVDVFVATGALVDLPTDAPPLPSDADVVAEAARALAASIAESVLTTLDVEPEPVVPRRLEIEPPVTDPQQIRFEPPPAEGSPTRVILPAAP